VNDPVAGRAFYLFDALGSVVNLATPQGTLLARYQWDAWGNLRDALESDANPFGFTGHEHDPETGLIYAEARFYDPEIGRFLSEDPAAGDPTNPPSLHKYLYAFANPTVFVDPDGEESVTSLLNEELVDSLAEEDYLKATGVFTLQVFYKLSDVLTAGFVSGHDQARDQYDAGLITREEYLAATGKAAAKSVVIVGASIATGGAAAAGAGALGFTATGTALVVGAAAGVGGQLGDDLVEGKLSSAEDYALAAGLGLVGGAVFRGGQTLVNRTNLGKTTVTEAARGLGRRVKALFTGESSGRPGVRVAGQEATRSAVAQSAVRDKVLRNIAESQRARAARAGAQLRNRVRGNIAESQRVGAARQRAQLRNQVRATIAESEPAGAADTAPQRLNGPAGDPGRGQASPTVAEGTVGNVSKGRVNSALRDRVLGRLEASRLERSGSNFKIHVAREGQALSGYAPDKWAMATLGKGSVVYGGSPGQTGFYTDIATVRASRLSGSRLFRSLQVRPHPVYGYRPQVRAYMLTRDIQVPVGEALANPFAGTGGGGQIFINNFESVLKPVRTFRLF